MKRLEGKHILLGVTGSIAVYKACEMLRILQRLGAEVKVVMTAAAQKFVAPLTFETLSRHEVILQLFPEHRVVKTRHISVAEWADAVLVCPATANLVGKVASGIADDFLTTAIMASRAPVIFAPAMDYEMVQNPIYLSNCQRLKDLGYLFVATEEGDLASGAKGPGRLAEFHRILDVTKKAVLGSDSFTGKKVVVSAGPTREAIDPVRYISNHSTGKMGFALAEEAALRGADVTLISGPTQLQPFEGIDFIPIQTACEMAEAVHNTWSTADVLIMSAAVADYKPADASSQKLKKESVNYSLQLTRTEDILQSVSKKKEGKVLVGFALETEDGENRAQDKLKSKNLDLICLNHPDAGFGEETNQVSLIDKTGEIQSLEKMPKWQVAEQILNRVEKYLHSEDG